MLKKIYAALAFGLALIPSAVLAQNQSFDPFAPFSGISDGVAQGMAVGGDMTTGSSYNQNSVEGGNIVIGDTADTVQQGAVIDGNVDASMTDGDGNRGGLNVVVSPEGQLPVLVMQGASVGTDVTLDSQRNTNSVQGVNVVANLP